MEGSATLEFRRIDDSTGEDLHPLLSASTSQDIQRLNEERSEKSVIRSVIKGKIGSEEAKGRGRRQESRGRSDTMGQVGEDLEAEEGGDTSRENSRILARDTMSHNDRQNSKIRKGTKRDKRRDANNNNPSNTTTNSKAGVEVDDNDSALASHIAVMLSEANTYDNEDTKGGQTNDSPHDNDLNANGINDEADEDCRRNSQDIAEEDEASDDHEDADHLDSDDKSTSDITIPGFTHHSYSLRVSAGEAVLIPPGFTVFVNANKDDQSDSNIPTYTPISNTNADSTITNATSSTSFNIPLSPQPMLVGSSTTITSSAADSPLPDSTNTNRIVAYPFSCVRICARPSPAPWPETWPMALPSATSVRAVLAHSGHESINTKANTNNRLSSTINNGEPDYLTVYGLSNVYESSIMRPFAPTFTSTLRDYLYYSNVSPNSHTQQQQQQHESNFITSHTSLTALSRPFILPPATPPALLHALQSFASAPPLDSVYVPLETYLTDGCTVSAITTRNTSDAVAPTSTNTGTTVTSLLTSLANQYFFPCVPQLLPIYDAILPPAPLGLHSMTSSSPTLPSSTPTLSTLPFAPAYPGQDSRTLSNFTNMNIIPIPTKMITIPRDLLDSSRSLEYHRRSSNLKSLRSLLLSPEPIPNSFIITEDGQRKKREITDILEERAQNGIDVAARSAAMLETLSDGWPGISRVWRSLQLHVSTWDLHNTYRLPIISYLWSVITQ